MSLEIGRLVLDLPGLDPERARAVGERVGAGLAGLELERSIERLSLTVPADADPDALAALIVAGVRAGTGGR